MGDREDKADYRYLLGEMQRQVDAQIETARHYEKLAWNVFRIQTAIGGLLLSALVVIATYLNLAARSERFPRLPLPTSDTVSNILAQNFGVFNKEIGSALLSIILLVTPLITVVFIVEFFFFPIWRAYQIQAPERLASGVEWLAEPPITRYEDSFERTAYQEYRKSIQRNEEIISEIKKNWNMVFKHIAWGIGNFTLVFLIVAFLFMEENRIIALPVFYSLAGMYFYFKEITEEYEMLLDIPYSKYSEVGYIATTLLVLMSIYLNARAILVFPLLIFLLIILYSIWKLLFNDKDENTPGILVRNLVIFLVAITYLGVYSLGLDILQIDNPPITWEFLGALVASLLLYTSLLIFIYLPFKTGMKLNTYLSG